MSTPRQSRCAARIEFLMLRYQLAACLFTSVLLLSPLAISPFIGGPVASAIFASVTVALAFLAQGKIAKRLFMGPPASAALIRVARDMLPLACRAKFDHEVPASLRNAGRRFPPGGLWTCIDPFGGSGPTHLTVMQLSVNNISLRRSRRYVTENGPKAEGQLSIKFRKMQTFSSSIDWRTTNETGGKT